MKNPSVTLRMRLLLVTLVAIGFANVLLVSEQLSAAAVAPKKQAPPLPPLPGAQKKELMAKVTREINFINKTLNEFRTIAEAAHANPVVSHFQMTAKLFIAIDAQNRLNNIFINLLQSK